MKKIGTMITAALISTTIFTACSKDSSMTDTAATPQNSVALTSTLLYQLQVQFPPSDRLIKWNKGYLSETELIFNATPQASDDVHNTEQFTTQEQTTIDLFNNPVLGKVNVPFGFYTSLSFSDMLAASNSFVLYGTFNLYTSALQGNMQLIPVILTINQPLVINSSTIGSAAINSSNYVVTLSLNMADITNGLTQTRTYMASY